MTPARPEVSKGGSEQARSQDDDASMAACGPLDSLQRLTDLGHGGSTLAAAVAFKLEQEIVRRGWPVGSVIGSEADLLALTGVSPPVLRQAIALLEGRQMARMRRGPGGGLVVTAPDQRSVTASVARYLGFLRVPPAVISEARAPLELMCLELAATRAVPEGVGRLRRLVDDEEVRLERGDWDCLAEFHLALADLGANAVLGLFVGILQTLLGDRAAAGSDPRPSTRPRRLRRMHAEHVAIVAALEAGDAELARRRMSDHLAHTRFDSPWWRDDDVKLSSEMSS